MRYIFNNSHKFKALSEDMSKRVQAAELDIKGRRDQINALMKQLQDVKQGTPDFKQMDEEVTNRKADLAAQVELQKKNFLRSEAQIYYTVYQEVAQEVAYYAKSQNVTLVLRFNGDPMDEHDPQNIASQLNKPVVYHDSRIDITPIILDVLNKRFDQASRTGPVRIPRR